LIALHVALYPETQEDSDTYREAGALQLTFFTKVPLNKGFLINVKDLKNKKKTKTKTPHSRNKALLATSNLQPILRHMNTLQ